MPSLHGMDVAEYSNSQPLLASWNVLFAKFLFSLLVCLALKFTDWYTRTFYDKNDEPYLLILKEQIDHLWSIDII